MGDVNKLPRWAQNRIEKLEADVAYWEGRVVEAETGETNTFLGDWPVNKGLPNDSRIVFNLPGGQVDVQIKDDHLRVMARGGGSLEIQPHVSNVIHIKTGRNW